MTIYRYNPLLPMGLSCVTGLHAFLALYFLVFSIQSADPLDAMFAALFGFGTVTSLLALLSRTSIAVDEQCIASCLFGIRIKVIRWRDAARIRKVRVTNGYSYVDSYHVVGRNPDNLVCRYFSNLCANIVFTQEIRKLSSVIGEINEHARRFAIPLVVSDAEAAAKLRANKWTTLKVDEVPTTKF